MAQLAILLSMGSLHSVGYCHLCFIPRIAARILMKLRINANTDNHLRNLVWQHSRYLRQWMWENALLGYNTV
jgi:hypothetical protein